LRLVQVTSARLATIANDEATFDRLVSEVDQVNPDVARLLRNEEEGLSFWEDDLFELVS
jgi:hypothetical protein